MYPLLAIPPDDFIRTPIGVQEPFLANKNGVFFTFRYPSFFRLLSNIFSCHFSPFQIFYIAYYYLSNCWNYQQCTLLVRLSQTWNKHISNYPCRRDIIRQNLSVLFIHCLNGRSHLCCFTPRHCLENAKKNTLLWLCSKVSWMLFFGFPEGINTYLYFTNDLAQKRKK